VGANDREESAGGAGNAVNGWQFASLGAVLLALVIVVALVVLTVDSDQDTAAGVLGVVIPALATIGAAVFGVKVGYDAGRTAGEARGEARGEAGKAAAVREGQAQVADQVKRLLPEAGDVTDTIVDPLQEASPSRRRTVALAVDGGTVDFDLRPVERIAASVAAARAICDSYTEGR
jgi:hypothetical protein